MVKRDARREAARRRRSRVQLDRHPPTFRDRPVEVFVSVAILALLGGLVAYGCTALFVD